MSGIGLYGFALPRESRVMPKSRRRPKKNAPLVAAQNLARGTRDPLHAIARARTAADVTLLPALAAWIEKVYRSNGLITGVEPKNLSLLQPSIFVEQTTLLKELVWAASLFERHASALQSYIDVRQQISDYILVGDFNSALASLTELEGAAGYSLFSVSTRIALLQASGGLDRQKDYVAALKADGASHNLNFFAYWWSIRAEPGTTAADFIKGVIARSPQWVVSEPQRALILFHLARVLPDEGEEAALLAGAMSSSAIDYYEAAVSLAVTAICEDRPSAPLFASFVATTATLVDDPRLKKLRLLIGHADATSDLPLADSGSWNQAVGSARARLTQEPRHLEDVLAIAVTGEEVHGTGRSVPDVLWAALRTLVGESPDGDRYPTDAERLGLVFAGIPLGDWLLALKSEQWSQTAAFPRPEALKRFVAVPELAPFILPHLSGPIADALASRFSSEAWHLPNADGLLETAALAREPVLARRALLEALLRQRNQADGITESAAVRCLELARSLRSSGYYYRRGLMTEIEALLETGDLDRAVEIFSRAVLDRSADPAGLPTYALKSALTQDVIAAHASNIYVPIALDIIVKSGENDLAPVRFYAAEDYMLFHGAERPTQLDHSALSVDQKALIYFLSEVCTPSILSLSVAFGTHAELQDERLATCRLLSQLDPDHADKYEQEALDINRARLVATALEDVQRTKITMDEGALRQWAARNIRRDYDRYITLLRSGVVVVNDEFREQLYAAVESGSFTEAALDIPDNEASALFASMVHRFTHECALSQEHGIDSYLSVRIRHGTVSGAVRGPVEAEHLVTRKSAGSNFYRRNQFWQDELRGRLDSYQAGELDGHLSAFSRRIDERIAGLVDDIIQVQRPERPKGLFNLTLSKVSVFALASGISAETEFDTFLDRCFDYFWMIVDQSLSAVRDYITGPFKDMVWSDFGELEEAFSQTLDGDALAHIRDALFRSRTEMMHALARMSEWFTMPTPLAKLPLDLEMLVELALATLRNFYPDFAPKVMVKADGLQPFTGVHALFADVFFILFENIMMRSGNDRDPEVEVRATLDGPTLLIRVENCVRNSEPQLSAIDQGIAEAKRKIATGAYRSAVRREGGSGFPKLLKLLQIDPNDEKFHFDLNREQAKFTVQLPIRVLEVAQ